MDIKNIVFDFDGVIADTEFFQLNVWKILLKERNLPHNNLNLSAIAGVPDLVAITKACPGLRKQEYVTLVKEKKNRCDDDFETIKPVPKIGKVFDSYYKDKHFFVCSNSPKKLIDNFMEKYFPNVKIECIVSKGDFIKPKPDPEPYLLLLKNSKITTDESVVIEDSIAGIKSAQQAGLNVIYLNRYKITIPNIFQIGSLNNFHIK